MVERDDAQTLTKEDALATLQQGRREISAEARWLQHQLSPTTVASHLMERHTVAMIAIAAGLGIIAGVTLIQTIHDVTASFRRPKVRRVRDRDE